MMLKHLKYPLIKSLLYFSILFSGFTFYYVGANRGYEIGAFDGVNTFILQGAKMGLVECHYVKKPECKKNECKLPVHPKRKPTQHNLFHSRQARTRKFVADSSASWNFELQNLA